MSIITKATNILLNIFFPFFAPFLNTVKNIKSADYTFEELSTQSGWSTPKLYLQGEIDNVNMKSFNVAYTSVQSLIHSFLSNSIYI